MCNLGKQQHGLFQRQDSLEIFFKQRCNKCAWGVNKKVKILAFEVIMRPLFTGIIYLLLHSSIFSPLKNFLYWMPWCMSTYRPTRAFIIRGKTISAITSLSFQSPNRICFFSSTKSSLILSIASWKWQQKIFFKKVEKKLLTSLADHSPNRICFFCSTNISLILHIPS